ncbi:MAG: 4'-phosphopantetheinyl transferase [Neolewinella sp.]|jgi:4'-phosphopantetheinyl transferase
MSGSTGRHRTLNQTPWAVAGAFPTLPLAGQVHLWRAPLSLSPVHTGHHYELLSPDEKQRAAKFHYSTDRDHFINARGILRSLLGQYLNLPAAAIEFTYSAYGKPDLVTDTPLSFNVSHAGGYGLFGFTSGAPLGVDLEKTDESIEVERLVTRFFSPTEAAAVLAFPPDDQPAAFFRTWTRKEAFIKAHGGGLSLPLDQFSVTVDLGDSVKIRHIDWAPETVADWSLASFMVREGLPGAMVFGGEFWEDCFFDYQRPAQPA